MDTDPGCVGEDQYDYRRVMDGQFVFDEHGDWKSVQYIEQLRDGDRDRLHDEQVEIMRSWDAMDLVMAICQDDPTSTVGGML